jgi:hypothetical protein
MKDLKDIRQRILDGEIGIPHGIYLTEVASVDDATAALMFAMQTIQDDPCGEGFHTHKSGVIHISIDLSEEEQRKYREFFK